MSRGEVIGAVAGWLVGVFLTYAVIEGDSVLYGIILPLVIGIPVTVGFMLLGIIVAAHEEADTP